MKKNGFTLIELIVVITILAILGTIAFISFKGYTSNARDSKVITDISNLQSSLSIFTAKGGTLPMPENHKIVKLLTNNITYEGELGSSILNQLKADKDMKTPEGNNYKYAVNGIQKQFTIIGELENEELSLYNNAKAQENNKAKLFKGDNILTLFDESSNFAEGIVDNGSLPAGIEAYLGDSKLEVTSGKVYDIPLAIKTNLKYLPGRNFFKDISCGVRHCYGLTHNGDLRGVGRNDFGQLGLGDKEDRSVWTKTSLINVKSIHAAHNHGYVIVGENRELWVTGHNGYGQLGLGNEEYVTDWRKTSLDDVSNIYGLVSGYAIKNGEVWVTGLNTHGELGLGDKENKTEWIKSSLAGIDYIEAGSGHAYALIGGTLWVIGDNTYGQLGLGDNMERTVWTDTGINGISKLSSGMLFGSFIKDGELWMVGRNNYGQLGVEDYSDRNTWTKTSLKRVIDVFIAHNFTYAVTSDGIKGTGLNKWGQLLTSSESENSWVDIKFSGASGIFINGQSAYLQKSGKLYTIGRNDYGQLGLGDFSPRDQWTEVKVNK